MSDDRNISRPMSDLMELMKSPDAALPVLLVNQNHAEYRLSLGQWASACHQAEHLGGWKPAGTTSLEDPGAEQPWPGSYDDLAGQLVTEADAKSLATALSVVSSTLPSLLGGMIAQLEAVWPKGTVESVLSEGGTDTAGVATGVGAFLKGLAAYCAKGAFRIYAAGEAGAPARPWHPWPPT
jgi:hypothetical protein